jgi:hypothetical protein
MGMPGISSHMSSDTWRKLEEPEVCNTLFQVPVKGMSTASAGVHCIEMYACVNAAQNSDTRHRVQHLKFAAFLDPRFTIWAAAGC